MKILYLSNSEIPSRTANSVHVMKMCQALAAKGHRVFLVTIGKEPAGCLAKSEIFRFYGIRRRFRVLSIDPKSPLPQETVRLPLLRWYARRQQDQFFRRLRPRDNIRLRFGFFRVAGKFRPRLVIARHLVGADVATDLGLETILEIHRPPTGAREQETFSKVVGRPSLCRVVVVTHQLKEEILKTGVAAERVLVLPDGADDVTDREKVAKIGLPGALRVGYVGHLYEGKGIEIIEKVSRRLPDVEFHVVGGMPEDIERWRSLAVCSDIHFHGFIPQAQIPEYMNAFDICLLPNQPTVFSYRPGGHGADIGRYTSPLKMFEYMAHKKAIIASDLPVLREVLHEDIAMLVDPENPDEWVSAIERLRDPGVRQRLSENAYREFLEKYTWDRRAGRLLAGR